MSEIRDWEWQGRFTGGLARSWVVSLEVIFNRDKQQNTKPSSFILGQRLSRPPVPRVSYICCGLSTRCPQLNGNCSQGMITGREAPLPLIFQKEEFSTNPVPPLPGEEWGMPNAMSIHFHSLSLSLLLSLKRSVPILEEWQLASCVWSW